jgi:hypothetical protein
MEKMKRSIMKNMNMRKKKRRVKDFQKRSRKETLCQRLPKTTSRETVLIEGKKKAQLLGCLFLVKEVALSCSIIHRSRGV